MYNRKLNKNIISFTHSILCTVIAYQNILQDLPNYHLLYNFSFGYFLWDIIYILINRDYNDLMFIYHHIICLLALNSMINNNDSEIINKVFFFGEASNFFNYVVYHCIKLDYLKKNIIFLKILQFLWFFYFRMILISQTIYEEFNNLNNKYFGYVLLSIHVLSFLWMSKQFKKISNYLLN
uniref:TLC domain-containing protein n=1 Tax=viral metagenome TaxID=1070528 RepID=A0A6C0IXX4_9ZZZZ